MRLQTQLRNLTNRFTAQNLVRGRRGRQGPQPQVRRPARREAQRRAHVRALQLETPRGNPPANEVADPLPDIVPLANA